MWEEMAMSDPEIIATYDRFVPSIENPELLIAQTAVVIQDVRKCYIEFILGEEIVKKDFDDLDVDSVCAIAKKWAEGTYNIND